jgi:hypothetical protein
MSFKILLLPVFVIDPLAGSNGIIFLKICVNFFGANGNQPFECRHVEKISYLKKGAVLSRLPYWVML